MTCRLELNKSLTVAKVGTAEYEVKHHGEYEVKHHGELIGYVHGYQKGKWEAFNIHNTLIHPTHTELNRWHAANYLLANLPAQTIKG